MILQVCPCSELTDERTQHVPDFGQMLQHCHYGGGTQPQPLEKASYGTKEKSGKKTTWWWFHFLFSFHPPPFWEESSHFYSYSSTGLVQPPTRKVGESHGLFQEYCYSIGFVILFQDVFFLIPGHGKWGHFPDKMNGNPRVTPNAQPSKR